MTFGERVKAQTRQYLLPKVAYNVFGSNVLATRLVANAKQGRGFAVEKPFKFQNSGQAAAFSGLDTFQTQQLETKARLSYDMRAFRQPIGISGLELIANSDSDVRVTDLLVEAFEETGHELQEKFGDYAYGDGSADSGKAPNGLANLIDDGTISTTIGAQSRATYPVLSSTVTSLAGVGGVISLSRLSSLYTNVSSGTMMTTPTLMISDEISWDLYEQLLTPTVRETYSSQGYYQVGKDTKGTARGGSNQGLVGMQGFVALSYKGIPWVRDEKASAQNIFMLNENWIDWYGWRAKTLGYEPISVGNKQTESTYSEAPMSDFSGLLWSGYRTAQQQFASIADVIMVGNMMTWQPRRQGKLTGASSI